MSDGLNGWGTTDTELPVSPLFCHLKDQLSPGSPGLKHLCPTRWTVRSGSVDAVLTN